MNRLADLAWENRFTESFPGDPETRNFTRTVSQVLYSKVSPSPVKAPKLVGWSPSLAKELGLSRPTENDPSSLEILAGNRVLPRMTPYAARYGGHQFGHWAGQLGDGRAITLGEVLTPTGRFELQLKGAGPTPYSRRADGRAVLRSSIREFLCSETMHFLGVPTTRALSLVTTGDAVIRDMFYDGHPEAEPGAIVCRVSPSFLRFGNFEILASNGEHALLRSLADFLIREHFPELDLNDPDVYGKYLDEVSRRTAKMVAEWMRVGFVHGVMNTDNMSALGLTIDYGPYGWLEGYDPGWTPNTTDSERRRYKFGSQPGVAHWNLGRLCAAFSSLVPDEARLQESLKIFEETFVNFYAGILANKLGVNGITTEEDEKLVTDLFATLQGTETDYTIFFRALSNAKSDHADQKEEVAYFWNLLQPAFYSPGSIPPSLKEAWEIWGTRYFARVRSDGVPDSERHARMKRANPKYVLRNYLSQNAIHAATEGDLSQVERLLRVLEHPYDEQPAEEDLAEKRPEWARHAPGCSALSCSS